MLTIKSSEERFIEVPPGKRPLGSSRLDEEDCDFCGKSNHSEDIPVVPDINENIYRLELKSAGRFCCSVTRIKFEVTRPVTLEFELDSWHNYLEYLPHKGSEVLGSLFKVTTPLPPHTVSAVYLPHDLCLKKFEGDASCIKCAHFKDGKLSVETPTQILPYYVVLENPSFSSLGVFFWNFLKEWLTKGIPIHGRVLLYFRTVGSEHMEYKMHLHFMPFHAPVKQKFHQQKRSDEFMKINTSSKTKTVYIKRKYTVNGPEEAHISPTELEVECHSPLEVFSSITISTAVQTIDLWLVEEGDTKKVWECHLSRGDLEDLLTKVSRKRRSPESKDNLHNEDEQSRHMMTQQSILDQHQECLKAKVLQIISSPTTQEIMREVHRVRNGLETHHKGHKY